jgi:hypothetical protein
LWFTVWQEKDNCLAELTRFLAQPNPVGAGEKKFLVLNSTYRKASTCKRPIVKYLKNKTTQVLV